MKAASLEAADRFDLEKIAAAFESLLSGEALNFPTNC